MRKTSDTIVVTSLFAALLLHCAGLGDYAAGAVAISIGYGVMSFVLRVWRLE